MASERRRRVLERTSIIDTIVAEIKDKIISGELKDGDMLASQDELARTMGVSRASLREALNRLSLMGLIETRQGTGTFVKTAKPLDFMNSLSSLLIMDQASAAELLDARLHIESAVAALAAKNATDEEVRQLYFLLERMKNDFRVGDADSFAARDLQFHILVAESSKNRVLMKVLEIIRDILRQFIRKFFDKYPTTIPMAVKYHQKIYEAIESRDSIAARKHMEDHIKFLIELNERSVIGESTQS